MPFHEMDEVLWCYILWDWDGISTVLIMANTKTIIKIFIMDLANTIITIIIILLTSQFRLVCARDAQHRPTHLSQESLLLLHLINKIIIIITAIIIITVIIVTINIIIIFDFSSALLSHK